MATVFGDVSVHVADDFVATVELHRPPNNYFDLILIRSLADALESLDAGRACRAIVLCSEGKHFCAGADFTGRRGLAENVGAAGEDGHLYEEALRLFMTKTRSSRRCRAPRSAVGSAWRWPRTFASRAPSRALPPTSRGWAFTTGLG